MWCFNLTTFLVELFKNHKLIKIFQKENYENIKADKYLDDLKEKNRKARKQASMDRQKAANRKRQELGERIFSDLDLRDILDEIGG